LFGLYYKWDDKNRQVEMAVAFPVASATKGDGNIEVINMNAAKCAAVDYWGDYSGIGNAHMELDKWLAANKKTSETPVLEEYIGDPEKEKDPMKVLTRVWYPLK
jgi:effector-binding domain-containing protein